MQSRNSFVVQSLKSMAVLVITLALISIAVVASPVDAQDRERDVSRDASPATTVEAIPAENPSRPNEQVGSEKPVETDRPGRPCLGELCLDVVTCPADGLVINEVVVNNAASFPGAVDDEGDPADWIELFNNSTDPVDLGSFQIVEGNNTWQLPDGVVVEAFGFQLLFATGRDEITASSPQQLHTNFKLKEGELLELVGGPVSHELQIPDDLRTDDSFGLSPDGDCTVDPVFFDFDNDDIDNDEPTPGDTNSTTSYVGYTPEPTITPDSAVAAAGEGTITPAADTTAWFTIENGADAGLEPQPGQGSSTTTEETFLLNECVSVRAIATSPDRMPSWVVSNTYINNGRTHDLPVFLLTGDPTDMEEMLASTPGITTDFEFSVNIDYLEQDAVTFSQRAGIKVNGLGGASSLIPMRSLRLNAGAEYGDNDFDFAFFDSKPQVDEFRSLILRNGGRSVNMNDWSSTMLREATAHKIIGHDANLDVQAYEPAAVYINCEYQGLHNLREKVNANYSASNYDIDNDDVNFYKTGFENGVDTYPTIKAAADAVPGDDRKTYLQSPGNTDGIDYDNFLLYDIIQRFVNNSDWGGNNRAKWQENPDGEFRHILNDLDGGYFGASDSGFFMNPNSDFARWALGDAAISPSEPIREDFLQSLAAHLSITLRPERTVPIVEDMRATIASEIANPVDTFDPLFHIGRWVDDGGIPNLGAWNTNVDALKTWYEQRPAAIYNFLEGADPNVIPFATDGGFDVTFQTAGGAGTISAHRVEVPTAPFDARMFINMPLELAIEPAGTAVFDGWYEGSVDPANLLSTNLSFVYETASTSARTIMANFTPQPNGPVLITEIMHDSTSPLDTGDYIELFNNTTETLSLAGYTLRDSNDTNVFAFPFFTNIQSHDYLVLCRDEAAFSSVGQPNGNWNSDCLDWGDFGLSDDDAVRLFDPAGNLVGVVDYGDGSGAWPTRIDGWSLQFVPVSAGAPVPDDEHQNDPNNWFVKPPTPGWAFH